jgi:thioesterase domain-containing protein
MNAQTTGESHDFHSQVIEAAFYRALSRYQAQPLPLEVSLFRPRQHAVYHLPDGRMLDEARQIVLSDNGWGPLVRKIDVLEVPGNHDSMVLEPNVRVLASALGRALDKASQPLTAKPRPDLSEPRAANAANGAGHGVAQAG